MRAMRWAFLLTGVLISLACDSGCDKGPPPKAAAPAKIRIVATAYPLANIAQIVGGENVKTDWVAEQGLSVDSIDPTSDMRAKIRQADMVVTNGTGEEWAVDGFDDPLRANSIVRLDLLDAAKAYPGTRQLWLDPAVAEECANAIADRLSLKRPQQAGLFRQNAKLLNDQLERLMREYSPRLSTLNGQKVLVLSGDYSALLRRAGIAELRPVDTSPLRLSEQDLVALRGVVRTEAPAAILVETGLPPTVERDLAERAGVPVIALDSLGTSAGVGRNNYLAILRFDFEQLLHLPPLKNASQ